MLARLWRGRPDPAAFPLPGGGYRDGLRAYRRLLAGGANALLDRREADDPAAWDAAEAALCDLVRAALDLPPLDPATGRGWGDEAALAVYEAFAGWCEKKGWRGQPSPTSPPATAAPADPPASSDCGCP